MQGQLPFVLLSSILAVGVTTLGAVGGLSPPRLDLVVLGDSFTASLDVATMRDEPAHSWATGTALRAPSVQQRLAAEGWHVQAANVARSGHRIHDIHDQLARAPARADLVLVWLGTNDLCLPDQGTARMAAEITAAFAAIRHRYPRAEVLVFAPPALLTIAQHQQATPGAADIWGEAPLCHEFFGREGSGLVAAQRQAGIERLLRGAAAAQGFHYSTALSDMDRPLAEWAEADYLHPSKEGSAWFAERAWPEVARLAGRPA